MGIGMCVEWGLGRSSKKNWYCVGRAVSFHIILKLHYKYLTFCISTQSKVSVKRTTPAYEMVCYKVSYKDT